MAKPCSLVNVETMQRMRKILVGLQGRGLRGQMDMLATTLRMDRKEHNPAGMSGRAVTMKKIMTSKAMMRKKQAEMSP